LRVIASSIRKGNVIEQDGKLYVVVSAENIHPGKGTPVSQIEMRRISDGVKISERYKTTDQVEKATIEERNYTFLYEDGDGWSIPAISSRPDCTTENNHGASPRSAPPATCRNRPQKAGIWRANQYVAARKPPQWPRDARVRIGRGPEDQEKQL